MSQPGQLVLDIAPQPSLAVEDFVAGQANAQARALVAQLAWPAPVGLLIGEAGAGKTHLAHLFARRFVRAHWFDGQAPDGLQAGDALVLDGLEGWQAGDEDAIFHALEAARAARVPVLVTSRRAPEDLALSRPDSLSRLRAGGRALIGQADDDLFRAIAVKLFTDRQLMVDPAIADYLLVRMERSYANLTRLIALIDERSLAAGRSITKALARDVLAAYELSQN